MLTKIGHTKELIWQLLAGVALLGGAYGCGQKVPDAAATITALQQTQELATVAYTYSKVVKASDNETWYKIGDRKILITCEARIKAGYDLSKIDPGYVDITQKKIIITLPPPQILSLSIPPEEVRVAYEDIGFFRSRFDAAAQNEVMRLAEAQIRQQADKDAILKDAEKNGKLWLTSFLMGLGFEYVEIKTGNEIQIPKK
jgi:hypothetical protein